MDDESLLADLRARGHLTTANVAAWEASAALLAVLDAIGRDGATAVVKVDGERIDGAFYTVVVSGGRLGEAFFRKDGPNLAVMLREAIAFYRARV